MQTNLLYYPDTNPGIRRLRRGRGFSYVDPAGCRIDCSQERSRLAALAVPPAYDDVWISPKVMGHLQASGRDARGRKQYRYHPDWTQAQAEKKYAGLAGFGRALPALRRKVAHALDRADDEEDFAVAAVIALLDRLALRVGSPEYAEENGSYGVTTLKRRHVQLDSDAIALRYRGKGGTMIRCKLRDGRIHRAMQRLDSLPGAQVFGWRDHDGQPRSVMAHHIKSWIEDVSDDERFSAKTFRTWSGTLAAFNLARDTAVGESLSISALSDVAAKRLHNTPTIARNSYIHPDVLDLTDAERRDALKDLATVRMPGLRRGEGALIAYLDGQG